MFPYPSGDGLHVGHPEGYTASDIVARYKRMRGFNVLHPMGWDAFGLPAEQYALKTGTHPRITTERNIKRFREQLKSLGFSYDWQREINTTDPGYYKWTQWIFKQLFERGLAYQEELPVWWCPELGTTLANEEVIDGKSEVGGFPCIRRPLRQWVLKITQYADALLAGLDDLDWPNSTKEMQRNWIGRSEGAEIDFAVDGHGGCAAARVHDAARHAVRRDLYGAGARARARRRSSPLPSCAAGSTPIATPRRARASSSAPSCKKTRRASSRAPMPSIRRPAARFRSGSPTTCSRATARARSWPCPGGDQRDFEFAAKFSLPVIRTVQPPADFDGASAWVGDGTVDQQRLLERQERRASEGRDDRVARARGQRRAPHQLQAARLAVLAATLLGRAVPDRVRRRQAADGAR